MSDANALWGDVRGWVQGSSVSVERIEELDAILESSGVPLALVGGLVDYLRPHLVPYAPGSLGAVVATLRGRWLKGELTQVLRVVHGDHEALVAAGLHDASAHLETVSEFLSDIVVHWGGFDLGTVSLESLPGVLKWAEGSSEIDSIFLNQNHRLVLLDFARGLEIFESILRGRVHELERPIMIQFGQARASDGRPMDVYLCPKVSGDGATMTFGFLSKDPSNILGSLELIRLIKDAAPTFEPRFDAEALGREVGWVRGVQVASTWDSLWQTYAVLTSRLEVWFVI